MLRPRSIFVSLFLLLRFPLLAGAQGSMAPPEAPAEFPRTYENSSRDLRWQLQDTLNAAGGPARSKLDSLVRQMEIPNSDAWFTNAFGQEAGKTWAGAYKANLGEAERNFENVLAQLADKDGEFLTRIVNDGPAPARKIETAMIKALRGPVEIYFVSWKQRGAPPESRPTVIGYFVFVDGIFRLDGAIAATELQAEPGANDAAAPVDAGTTDPSARGMDEGVYRPGVGGVGTPSCAKCPDPKYSKLARKKKLEGTVVLQVIIQPDGGITDIRVVKSPDPELTQAAIDAVSKWSMIPARRADGKAVPVVVPIEVLFRILK